MSTIKFDADISDFITKANQVSDAMEKQKKSAQGLIQTTSRFNAQGQETSGIMKKQVDANTEMEVSYRRVQGVLQATGVVLNKTTEAMRRFKEEQQKVASAANLKAVDDNLIGRGRFKDDDLKQLQRIKTAIGNLNATIVDPKIIKGFLEQLRAGKSIEATGTLGKLRDQLQKLVDVEQRLKNKAENKRLSDKVLDRFKDFSQQELIPVKFGIKEDELKAKAKTTIRNALENIKGQIVLDPTINITKLRSIFDQLKANPLQTFDDKKSQVIANQLSRILAVYKQIEDTKKRQAQLDSNALDKSGKTAEAIERESKRAASIARIIQREAFNPQQNRVAGLSPGAKIDEGRLSVLGRKIAELGQKAGLSNRQIMDMFNQVNSGDFSKIDGKYNRLTQKIIQYNNLIKAELARLAKEINNAGGGGGGGGGGGRKAGDLDPDGTTMTKAREFAGIMEKVKTSLQFFFIYKGFSTLQEGLVNATAAAAQFEDQVSLIRTISQESQLTTAQWTSELSKLSSKLGIEFTDAAKAAYDAVSNQIAQGVEVFSFIEQAGNLAKTTNSSLQDSTNLLSSVINTYGAEAGTVEDVAASLFKTIDRGRIVASDLSNTFGRVLFTSQDVGVSFKEVEAAMALMTRSGVTADDAMTLLNNLLLQIRKPSEELQKVFDEMGIGSSQNAIKIKGLVGILKELQGAAAAGKIDVSKMFPEIRAERAATFLFGRVDQIKDEIRIIGDEARDTFQKAIEIRDEPIIQKINKIKNTIQNALATTVGEGVNRTIVGIAERVTGKDINEMVKDQKTLEESIEKVQFAFSRAVRIAASFGAGLLALKGSMSGIAIVIELVNAANARKMAFESAITARMIQNTALTRQQAVAEEQLAMARARSGGAAAVGRFGGPAGLAATALITGITAYSAYKAAVVDTFSASQQAVDEYVKSLKDIEAAKELKRDVDALNEVRSQMSAATQGVLQKSAAALSQINTKLAETRAQSAKAGEALRSGFVGYLDIAKNRIQEAERAMSQLTSRIESAGKAGLGFRQKLDDIVFGNQQQYATDPQFLEVTRNRIKALTREAAGLYNQNTEEGVSKGRELFDKIADLQNQYHQRVMQMRIKEQEAAGGGVVLYDPNEQLRDQNQTLRIKEALEAKSLERLKEEKATLETNTALQKAKLDEFQKALTKFEEFSPTDASGGVKKDFQNPFGQVDMSKVRAEYDRLTQVIETSMNQMDAANRKVGEKPTTIAERVNIKQMIIERKKLIEQELGQVTQQKETIKLQEKIIQNDDEHKKGVSEVIKAQEEYNTKLRETLNLAEQVSKANVDSAKKFEETFQKMITDSTAPTALGRGLAGAANDLAGVFGLKASFKDKEGNRFGGVMGGMIKEYEAAEKKFQESVTKRIKINGRDVIDIDAVKKAFDELDKFAGNMEAEMFRNIKAFEEIPNRNDVGPETMGQIEKIAKDVENARKAREALRKSIGESEKMKPADNALEKANKDLETFREKIKDLGLAPEALTKNVSSLIGGIGSVAEKSNEEVDTLLPKLREIAALNEKMNIRPAEAVAAPPMPGKAYGGPIGHDNIPIWAQAGEIMANRQASTDYYSQIMAMNNTSRVPQYFSGGGMVQGGDTFNITVNESKTPQLTARQIHRSVRSNQRRG